MQPTFDELVAEADAVSVAGWDFSWLAVDSSTHIAYTANSPDNTVSVIEARK